MDMARCIFQKEVFIKEALFKEFLMGMEDLLW
jgi:hypothetical protein